MAEPIPMEKFQKGHKGRLYEARLAKRLERAHPDDWIVEALCQEIEHLTENSPIITHSHIRKLRRAFREQPETVLGLMREKIVPFFDALPEIDRTIVGADAPKLGGDICLKCLTRQEASRLDGGEFYTRDDADEYELTCKRCGKRL